MSATDLEHAMGATAVQAWKAAWKGVDPAPELSRNETNMRIARISRWDGVAGRRCLHLINVTALVVGLKAFAAEPGGTAVNGKIYDVRDLGAAGDGETIDTAAIQRALDQCEKTGGGTVFFRPGTYLSKPLFLRAKTTLKLEAGAILKATDERADFLKPGVAEPPDSSGDFYAFINGKSLTEIAITGQGVIDGSGARWWGPAREAKNNPTNTGYTLPRPRMILLSNCRNVRIQGVSLVNSPSFHLVPEECENVVIEEVTITAPDEGPNTDGIDPSRSRRVRISKCRIGVGDDNVAIKSGRAVPGREFACEDITITDCVFLHGHGLSIGSETEGGVRNVCAERCTFIGTENGLRIKSPRGRGGRIENIIYSDITMTNVETAIVLTCYYPKVPNEDVAKPLAIDTPRFRNLVISNLTATCSRDAGIIVGLPESPVTEVLLENVRILAADEGLTIRNAKSVRLQNADVKPGKGPPIVIRNAEVEGMPE